jgi:hypothetical protein
MQEEALMGTTTLKLDWSPAVLAAVASALEDEIGETAAAARDLAGTAAGQALAGYRENLGIALDDIERYRDMAAAAVEP